MDLELLIRFAGVGLALIAVANLIVPRMLDYAGNLARVDRMFGQVFRVHAAYTVVTVAGMAILCLWRPDFFLTDGVGRGVCLFMGLYWGSRFLLQMVYYDRRVRRQFRAWDVAFGLGFFSLGAGFLTIAFLR